MTPRFIPVGDSALSVEWPEGPKANAQALALKADLTAHHVQGVLESVPALRSLLLRFDPLLTDPAALEQDITQRLKEAASPQAAIGRSLRIPVCYDPELAPDLETLAKAKKMTADELVALHTGVEYTALFLGFLPGFAYLSGLPEALHTPRLETPRARVPAGSVALAGDMSAVYPLESPGGWHLIGRTPLKPFDAARAEPFLFAPGDRIGFFAIARSQFDSWPSEGP